MPVMRPERAINFTFCRASVEPGESAGQFHQGVVEAQYDGSGVAQPLLIQHVDQPFLVDILLVLESFCFRDFLRD